MKYVLYNKKKNKYFKEYQGNKPVWCDSILDAVQYHTMIALRMQKRLACQSQIVILLVVQYKGIV